jgi:hypothetical protein
MLNALLSKLKKEQNDSHMLDLSTQIKEKNRKIELQNELLKSQNVRISELNSDILKMNSKMEELHNENFVLELKKNIRGKRLIKEAEKIKILKMELKQEMDSKLDVEREYKESINIRNFILDKAFSKLCNLSKSTESSSKGEDCLCLQAVIKDLLGISCFDLYTRIYKLVNGQSEEFKDLEKKKLHLELLNPDKESTYPVDVDALVINEQVLRLIKGYISILKFYDMAVSEFKFNNDYDDYGQEYEFIEGENLNNIAKPECDCGEYEISDTFTVRGHKINSNCDTWGTDCGAKAESLYVFYLPEKGKYIFVKEWYWEM